MPTTVTCPDCEARLTLREARAGTRIKCPKCSVVFDYVGPDESERPASKKLGISTSPPPASRPRREADEDSENGRRTRSAGRRDDPDDEDDRPQKRKSKKARGGSNTGLIVGLSVGAGVLVLGLVALVIVLAGRPKNGGDQQATANSPQVAPPANNAPPNNAPAVAPPNNAPPNNGPAVAPPNNAPALPAGKPVRGEMYGDQGGGPVAPADAGLPNTLMRARGDDTFFKLSNPREEKIRGPDAKGKGNHLEHDALVIDYSVHRRGRFDGGTLVIIAADGSRSEVALNSVAGRDHGTIELVGVERLRGKGKAQPTFKTAFPKNAEIYVTRGDDRYRPPPKFMVSNSVTLGAMKQTTSARDWTPEEKDIYGKPPPGYLAPNEYPTVGEDVPPLNGWSWKARFVEPDGRLLGLEYHMGEWNKEKRIGGLVPVFSLDQPPSKPMREVARAGYAVAGTEVNFNKDGYVYGIRPMYRRVKPDGSLDAADAYAGQWIGTPPAGQPQTLANDGRRVIGISYQSGAVVDRFALVVGK